MSYSAIPTVIILVESRTIDTPALLLQKRIRHNDPSDGYWEVPQGKIYPGESPFAAAMRELKAETGLDIDYFLDPTTYQFTDKYSTHPQEVAWSQFPAIFQKDGEQCRLGFVVRVRAKGIPHNTKEARNHEWMGLDKITELLKTRQIFSLDVSTISEWACRLLPQQSNENIFSMYHTAHKSLEKLGRPAICFDLGGVLIKYNSKGLKSRLASLFATSQANIAREFMNHPISDDLNRGEATMVDVYDHLMHSISTKTVEYATFIRTWKQCINPIPENVKLLQTLRNTWPHLQYAIGSNTDELVHESLYHTQHWYRTIDYLHLSFRTRHAKPYNGFYTSLEERLEVAGNKILFFEDKEPNITQAIARGWNCHLVNRNRPIDTAIMTTIDEWQKVVSDL